MSENTPNPYVTATSNERRKPPGVGYNIDISNGSLLLMDGRFKDEDWANQPMRIYNVDERDVHRCLAVLSRIGYENKGVVRLVYPPRLTSD